MRHGMGGFCCGVGELEISSGEASQQTEVKGHPLSAHPLISACQIKMKFSDY